MIKARAETDSGPVIILGLSAENVKRLMDGHPIKVEVGDIDRRLDGVKISIVYGKTEIDIVKDMERVGLIGPGTQRRDD